MGEPLKNKGRRIIHWGDKKQLKSPVIMHMFYHTDIKSAVEWLKEEIRKVGAETICDLVNQAFPDLQPPHKEGKK